jgi:hypothetical protein
MEMAAKVHPTCVQHLVPHFAPKPFAVEKASPQHFREWQLEEEATRQLERLSPRQQLDPLKRRAESIPRRTYEVFDWKNNIQYTDDRAKVCLDSFPMIF